MFPTSSVVVSSADECDKDTEEDDDPETQEMDTQEPQSTGDELSSPRAMPMGPQGRGSEYTFAKWSTGSTGNRDFTTFDGHSP